MALETSSVNLWQIPVDALCEVVGFDAEMPDAYRVRLMEFGFHPGEAVICLHAPVFGAPRVFRVSNTVYSLDRDIAERVLVVESLPTVTAS